MKTERRFLILDGDGRNLDVVARLDPYFSVTCQRGAAHDEILAMAPAEVRDDLAALVALHLRDRRGWPMHAAANAAHFVERGEFDTCAGHLPNATVEDVLGVTRARDLAFTKAGGDALGAAEAAAVEAARRVVRLAAKVADAVTDSGRGSVQEMERSRTLHGALLDLRAAMLDAPEPVGVGVRPTKEQADQGKRLRDKGLAKVAATVARDGTLSPERRAELKAAVTRNVTIRAVEAMISERLAATWAEDARKGAELLAGPDFRIASRPAPEVDPRTFEGFAMLEGLSVATTFVEHRRTRQPWGTSETSHWTCTLTHAASGKSLTSPYQGPEAPTVGKLLEAFQNDVGTLAQGSLEERLRDMGFEGGVDEFREQERMHEACRAEARTLADMLGIDGLRRLMSDVGDDPPMRADDVTESLYEDAHAPTP